MLFGGRERLVNECGATLFITLGSRGFEINDGEGRREYPCIKIKPVDTTAAGDTLCTRFAEGESLNDAAKVASLTADRLYPKGRSAIHTYKGEVEAYKAE